MTKTRIVKYAGVSLVTTENGETSAHFHTSNNSKYAVWSVLPEKENGPGHSVTFTWFKMPANTEKLQAVRYLQRTAVAKTALVSDMLSEMITKSEPKPRKERKAKTKTVTVEVTPKKLSNADADKVKAANLQKIRDAAAKRKATAA